VAVFRDRFEGNFRGAEALSKAVSLQRVRDGVALTRVHVAQGPLTRSLWQRRLDEDPMFALSRFP